MTGTTPEERAQEVSLCVSIQRERLTVYHVAFDEIEASIKDQKKKDARIAETISDFGPSTQCPDCGSSRQVLHWYTLGRKDAAAEIRKGLDENNQ